MRLQPAPGESLKLGDIKLAPETLFEVKPEGGKYLLTQGATKKTIEADPASESDLIAPTMQFSTNTKYVGGLHVIGTERHTARRIDNQLRGRSGRQGDPGSSRFYVSLQDELMQLFAGEWTINVLKKLGMGEGEALAVLGRGVVDPDQPWLHADDAGVQEQHPTLIVWVLNHCEGGTRRTDEGDPEQQHQDRHAADDLDIEAGDLA